MNTKMLEYIGDMNDFLGENWEAFQEYMERLGFTEDQVDALSEELSEFLEGEKYPDTDVRGDAEENIPIREE